MFCEPLPRVALRIAELPADFVVRRSHAPPVPRIDRADRHLEQLRNFLDRKDVLRPTIGYFVRLLRISWWLVGWRALRLRARPEHGHRSTVRISARRVCRCGQTTRSLARCHAERHDERRSLRGLPDCWQLRGSTAIRAKRQLSDPIFRVRRRPRTEPGVDSPQAPCRHGRRSGDV